MGGSSQPKKSSTFKDSLIGGVLYEVTVKQIGYFGELPPGSSGYSSQRRVNHATPDRNVNLSLRKEPSLPGKVSSASSEKISSVQMPETENIRATATSGLALTGAAAKGPLEPVVSSIECNDMYCFLVSLPGVEKTGFSCEVKPEGKVKIKGVSTTGQKTVQMDSIFKMQAQYLCPPGLFAISLQLPSPVDFQGFSCDLADGILEGIVMKQTNSKMSILSSSAFSEKFLSQS